jgi:hypothetical protein
MNLCVREDGAYRIKVEKELSQSSPPQLLTHAELPFASAQLQEYVIAGHLQ